MLHLEESGLWLAVSAHVEFDFILGAKLRKNPNFVLQPDVCYMKILREAKRAVAEVLRLLFPEKCAVCGRRLEQGEQVMCNACFAGLPRTNMCAAKGNVVERLFWGKIPVERANAYMYYQAGTASCHPIFQLKYYGRVAVGFYFGRIMAADLQQTDFFNTIDCIVPVPLAKSRQQQRGYNQSELLAEGIAEWTKLPVERSAVERVVANPTQTHLNVRQRIENVADIFRLQRPELLENRHVLLVDDVLTTGATLLSCAEEVAKAKGVRISVLVLGLAGHHSLADLPRGGF